MIDITSSVSAPSSIATWSPSCATKILTDGVVAREQDVEHHRSRSTSRVSASCRHSSETTVDADERRSPEVEMLPETSFAAMADFFKPVLKLRGIPVA